MKSVRIYQFNFLFRFSLRVSSRQFTYYNAAHKCINLLNIRAALWSRFSSTMLQITNRHFSASIAHALGRLTQSRYVFPRAVEIASVTLTCVRACVCAHAVVHVSKIKRIVGETCMRSMHRGLSCIEICIWEAFKNGRACACNGQHVPICFNSSRVWRTFIIIVAGNARRIVQPSLLKILSVRESNEIACNHTLREKIDYYC